MDGEQAVAKQAVDGELVPCDRRTDGSLRFVWDLPYGRILIDVHPDGGVAVNGRAVAPAPRRDRGVMAGAAWEQLPEARNRDALRLADSVPRRAANATAAPAREQSSPPAR